MRGPLWTVADLARTVAEVSGRRPVPPADRPAGVGRGIAALLIRAPAMVFARVHGPCEDLTNRATRFQ